MGAQNFGDIILATEAAVPRMVRGKLHLSITSGGRVRTFSFELHDARLSGGAIAATLDEHDRKPSNVKVFKAGPSTHRR